MGRLTHTLALTLTHTSTRSRRPKPHHRLQPVAGHAVGHPAPGACLATPTPTPATFQSKTLNQTQRRASAPPPPFSPPALRPWVWVVELDLPLSLRPWGRGLLDSPTGIPMSVTRSHTHTHTHTHSNFETNFSGRGKTRPGKEAKGKRGFGSSSEKRSNFLTPLWAEISGARHWSQDQIPD